jgi:putative glutamine transport system substrate-binding protein
MVGKIFASQPTGIAVQKGNQELLEKLNKSLAMLKENGTYDRLCEKWFGSSHLTFEPTEGRSSCCD